jgi:cytidyltransferase-like protein
MANGLKTVLFSGRFDNVHPGHIATIQRLGQIYKKVIVVILDYSEQKYPVYYRAKILSEILSSSKGDYEIHINSDHFAKISKKALSRWKFDVYAAGNLDVLMHIEKLGYEVLYVDRAYDFSASAISLISNISPIKNV